MCAVRRPASSAYRGVDSDECAIGERDQRSEWTDGQAIVRAILAGERDPRKLAELSHPRIRRGEIAKSLRQLALELLFVLKRKWRCMTPINTKSPNATGNWKRR